MQWVFDASIAMAWCFEDETTPETEQLLDRLISTPAVVPQVWALEIANVLALAGRKKRIRAEQIRHFTNMLAALPIQVDSETSARAFTSILQIADRHQRTSYDSAYLELAIRLRIPLATLDQQLRTAARNAGVTIL